MKQFSGYEAKKAVTRENLPVGGYVAKILNAEEMSYSWGPSFWFLSTSRRANTRISLLMITRARTVKIRSGAVHIDFAFLTMTEASKTAGLKDHSTMPCTVSRTETLVITGTGTRQP